MPEVRVLNPAGVVEPVVPVAPVVRAKQLLAMAALTAAEVEAAALAVPFPAVMAGTPVAEPETTQGQRASAIKQEAAPS